MTLVQKQQDKAEEYRDRAAISAGLAETSALERVREMHLRAAATWTEMADLHDRAAFESGLRLAAATHGASPIKPLLAPSGDDPAGDDSPAEVEPK